MNQPWPRPPPAIRLALSVWLVFLPSASDALTLVKKSTTSAGPGLTIERYASTSPKTNLWVAKVDLCKQGVHVDATRAPSGLKSPASWGAARGASLATNGDFYKTGPVRVYGDAVGEGVRWPAIQTGLHSAYSGEWYWHDAGWIAFLHDRVEFSHTGWQKKNGKGLTAGWSPGAFSASLPAGVLALVGGFPELVVEGKVYKCSSPTATSCFPDRSDMRARHPRTAMGLTADRKTFMLVVVDGRTSASIGMYGAELADLMGKLGAWEAFNLDGGGSSQMWVSGKGTLNNASGNNNGGGLRGVANHWGVLTGATAGYPSRPGHCKDLAPCGVVGAAGGTLQETSACFRTFGPPKYWRTEKVGNGGGLRWTNAGNSGVADNWAWWRLNFAQAGTYKVETAAHKTYGVYAKTHYEVRAGGASKTLTINQSKPAANGWIDLGTYNFAAGGAQWVGVYDDHTGAAVVDQHIVADALRLTRLEPWCGSGKCAGGETCKSCASDCGACPPACGDGACNGGETCKSCASDCGACPVLDAGGSTDLGSPSDGGAPPEPDAALVLPDLGGPDPRPDDTTDFDAGDDGPETGASGDVAARAADAAHIGLDAEGAGQDAQVPEVAVVLDASADTGGQPGAQSGASGASQGGCSSRANGDPTGAVWTLLVGLALGMLLRLRRRRARVASGAVNLGRQPDPRRGQ